MAGGDLRKAVGALVELPYHGGRGPFLRTKHGGGALRPTERIGYVAGQCERAVGQRTAQRIVERALRCQPVHQGAQHAQSGVARRTAAQSHHKAVAPLSHGLGQQFAHAIRGGAQRVALVGCEARQTTCLGHLHHSRAVGHEAVGGVDGAHQRVVGARRQQAALGGGHKRTDHALAPIGRRHGQHNGSGQSLGNALSGCCLSLGGGEAALQRVDGQNHFLRFGCSHRSYSPKGRI